MKKQVLTVSLVLTLVLAAACAVLILQKRTVPAPEPSQPVSAPATAEDALRQVISAFQASRGQDRVAVDRELTALRALDASQGAAWETLMDYWFSLNASPEISAGELPSDLPQDESLCLVVLGYQLNADGSMAPELIGRCETALRCARQYPHALIAVTGGGTAAREPSATEADAMARYLTEHGIAEERILVENRSLSTVENARLTCGLLRAQHPEVQHLAIITSDYHIPWGSILFAEEWLLQDIAAGQEPHIAVVANAAFITDRNYDSFGAQVSGVKALADIR